MTPKTMTAAIASHSQRPSMTFLLFRVRVAKEAYGALRTFLQALAKAEYEARIA